MKLLTSMLIVAMCFATPLAGAAADPEGSVFLRLIEGDVQMKMGDNAEWVPAAANTPLYEGDRIWVPDDARAEVRFQNGITMRLGANTAAEAGTIDNGSSLFYVDEGRAYVHCPASGQAALTIHTPTGAFAGDPGSIYRIEVDRSGYTTASALVGNLYVDREAGQMTVRAGERLCLAQGAQYPQLSAVAPEDEWGRWNRQRDQEIYTVAQGPSSRYLPDELRGYAPELDANGRWENTAEYGYVWTPTVVITVADWAPYRSGRWVWIRGDYVWISYDRWGWAPHHYGRWASVHGRWCWIPPGRGAAHWGPGYVGWVQSPTHVAWVPLAPRETYYGRGNRGPYTVNVTQINTQRTVINNNAFRNVRVTNAVTTLHRDAFLGSRTTGPRIKENLFLTQHASVGAPQLRPIHATAMPAIRQIPAAKRPPERIAQAHANGPRSNQSAGRPGNPSAGTWRTTPVPNNNHVTADSTGRLKTTPAPNNSHATGESTGRMKAPGVGANHVTSDSTGRMRATPAPNNNHITADSTGRMKAPGVERDGRPAGTPVRPATSLNRPDGRAPVQTQTRVTDSMSAASRPHTPPAAGSATVPPSTRYTNQDIAPRRPAAPQAVQQQAAGRQEPPRTAPQPRIARPSVPPATASAPSPPPDKRNARAASTIAPPERQRQAQPPNRDRQATTNRTDVRPGPRVLPAPPNNAPRQATPVRPAEQPRSAVVTQRPAPTPAVQAPRVSPPPRSEPVRQEQKAAPERGQAAQARAEKPGSQETKTAPQPAREQPRPSGRPGA